MLEVSFSKETVLNIVKNIAVTLVLLVLITLGNEAGLVPLSANADTALPEIIAKVEGVPLDISAPNHVALPATIVFTANMPVTIHYTTNGEMPTTDTATRSTIRSACGTDTGPTITSTEYMLMVVGVDGNGSLTPLLTYTFLKR